MMLIGFLCLVFQFLKHFIVRVHEVRRIHNVFSFSVIVSSLQHINYGCHIPLEMKRWASLLENPKSHRTISDNFSVLEHARSCVGIVAVQIRDHKIHTAHTVGSGSIGVLR